MSFDKMRKGIVDPKEDIVVFVQKNKQDLALSRGFMNYTRLQTDILNRCRRETFCILAHGERHNFTALNEQETLGLSIVYYQKYRRGRNKLLLLSCLTGLGVAKKVAESTRATVIAPTGLATIDDDGSIRCGTGWVGDEVPHGEKMDGTLNWVSIDPNGGLSFLGDSVLTKLDF